MGRRNYTIVEYDARTNELCFDIRVEKAKGIGTTVGCVYTSPSSYPIIQWPDSLAHSYAVRAPRPGWQAP
jgi:hypothetical protein